MNVPIRPSQVTRFLLQLTTLVVGLGLVAVVVKFGFDHDTVLGLLPLFDLDAEQTIPAFFTTLLFFLTVLLLLACTIQARENGESTRAWWGLGAVFTFLALDEYAAIHERLVEPLRGLMDLSGPFHYAWVIPYGLLALVLGLIYLRFIQRLPGPVRGWVVRAGLVYLGGALGVEMLSAWYFTAHDERPDFVYGLLVAVEESMEMVGLILFIRGLLERLAHDRPATLEIRS